MGGSSSTNTTTAATRISTMQLQSSAYGRCIPIIYGTNRVAGNIFWYDDFTATPHTTKTSSGGGGKGGGGSSTTTTNTTYTYSCSLTFGLCEGEINGVGNIWEDKKSLSDGATNQIATSVTDEAHYVPINAPYVVTVNNSATFYENTSVTAYDGESYYEVTDYSYSNGIYTFNGGLGGWAGYQVLISYSYLTANSATPMEQLGFTLFNGSYTQGTWGFLTSNHPTKALAYRGTAYVAASAFDLGDSASMSQMNFEVRGLKIYNEDAIPYEIIKDFLTNENYGLGFPTDKIGDMTQFLNYTMANGIFISPMFDEQQSGADHLSNTLKMCNASPVWSEGLLKIIPYGDSVVTGNGYTYAPDLTPIYDLDDSDFIDTEEPIKITRSSNADAYNDVKIEFLNRSNDYNSEIAESKDLANIDMYGLRTSDTNTMHGITKLDIAKHVAQLILQRTLYVRNTYEFTLTWKYSLLEPMDLVTLTDPPLGLDKTPVRITTIEEQDDATLKFTAEEFPFGVASATAYPSQKNDSTKVDYLVTAGSTNNPVIFEPPLLLSNAYEIWIGLSGGENWGGADIWVSYDGNTYSYLTNVAQRARTGYVTGTSSNIISVDLSECAGTLVSTSEALALIGSEIVKYSTVTLTGANKYDLIIIERGLYGTDEVLHVAGDRFLRLDAAIAKESYTSDMVGRTIHYKALAYNVYGSSKQSLADVEPFYYKILGSADLSPLPDVTNLVAYYKDNINILQWTAVIDQFRAPIDYEVRRGSTWGNAQILGRTSALNFQADINGTYLVKAHYSTVQGTNVYSENAVMLVIDGATIVKNVVATWDEKATGWTGILSGGAEIEDNNLVLGGDVVIDAIPDFDALQDFDILDSISGYGAYEIPTSHIITLNAISTCRVSLNYTVSGQNISTMFDNIADIDSFPNIDGDNADYYAVFPKIAISQDGTTWSAWQDFYIADYVGKAFKCKLDIYGFNESTQPIVSEFSFTVDIPDRIEKGTSVVVESSGLSVTYAQQFQTKPNLQITIMNASEGDKEIITSDSNAGFMVVIKNSGANVSRSINWQSQGF